MNKQKELDIELVESFAVDALDLLRGFERAALSLETDASGDALRELFRTAHTLKGSAMGIGLDEYGFCVHKVEDLIQLLCVGEISPSREVVDILISANARLKVWAQGLSTNPRYVPSVEDILAKVAVVHRDVKDRADVDGGGHRSKSTTALESREDLEAVLEFYKKQGQPAGGVNKPRKGKVSVEERARRHKKLDHAYESLKFSTRKLEEIIDLVGELSSHQEILKDGSHDQESRARSAQAVQALTLRLVHELHSTGGAVRRVSIKSLMLKLQKTATLLAQSQGKKVRVVLEGEDVELNSSVYEKLSAPLVHVIRNAVDHGVESSESRVAQGKSTEATITIGARREEDGVSVTVSDDGQGLNDRAIFSAAVKKGLVGQDEKLSSEEIRRFIFEQGFSTASKLTEVSGRGVGMDVVFKAVQELEGVISLTSEEGRGTSVSIRIPEARRRDYDWSSLDTELKR
jgi:two-component system chemotaxis sensor kinase CheA